MKQILRVLFVLVGFNAFSQTLTPPPGEQWADEYDYSDNGIKFSTQMRRGASGNDNSLFVVGWYANIIMAGTDRGRYIIRKYNASGKEWEGAAVIEECGGVRGNCPPQDYTPLATSDGGVVIYGKKLVRYSNSGAKLWDKSYTFAKVVQASDGHFFGLQGNTITKVNNSDGSILIPAQGVFASGIIKDFIATTADGGLLVTGLDNADNSTIKLGSNLNRVWNKGEQGHRVLQFSNGDYLLWGDFGVLRLNSSGDRVNSGGRENKYDLEVADQKNVRDAKLTSDGGCILITASRAIKLTSGLERQWFSDGGGDNIAITTDNAYLIRNGNTIRKISSSNSPVWNGTLNVNGTAYGIFPASDKGFFVIGDNYRSRNNGFTAKYGTDPTAPVCNGTISIAGNQDQSFCEGSSLTLTANPANTMGTVTLQWKKDGTNIGDGKNTLTVSETGTYTVTMTYDSNCPVKESSNSIKVTRNPRPTANAGPNVTLKQGESHTISGQPTTQSYLWTTNPVVGGHNSTSANPTFGPFDQNTTITLVVTANGCESQPSTAQITVQRCNLSVNISGTTEFCAGSSTTLTANANGIYQWKRNGVNVGDGKNTLTVTEGGSYTVDVTDGGCKATAQAVTLIKSDPKVSIKADRTEYCADSSVPLTGEASGGIGKYAYVWKKDGAPTGGNSNQISEAKAGTYTLEVSDEKGCKSPVAEQKITENPKPTANAGEDVTKYGSETHTVTGLTASGGTGDLTRHWSTNPGVKQEGSNDKPTFGPFNQNTEITLRVTDVKGCEATDKATVTYSACPLKVTVAGGADYCAGGTPPTLTANVTGQAGTPRYEWKRDDTNVGDGKNTLTASEPGRYTVTVTDERCSLPSGEITIRKSDIKITIQADKTEFCAGETTTLRATATGGLDGYTTYQWKGPITGGNSERLPNATGGSYTVEVTDGKGCKVISNAQVLTENPKPSVTLSGESAFCEGGSALLTASISGGTPPYRDFQWKRGESSVSNRADPLRVTEAGTYQFEVRDAKGCASLDSRTVTMNALPKIGISGDAQRQICVLTGEGTLIGGGSGVLVSQVTSGSVNAYQWLRNDQPVPTGGTTGQYTFTQPGTYTVRVTTAGCADFVTSAPVTVTQRTTDIVAKISPAGPLTLEPANNPVPVSLTASSRAGYGYQWQRALNTGPVEVVPGATGPVYNAQKPGTYHVDISQDGCVVRSPGVVVALLTGTEQERGFELRLHPNPAHERVRVEVTTEQPEALRVRLLSPNGGEVGQWRQDQRTTHHVFELDLGAVPEGLYFLHLQAGPHRLTRKVIRVR